MDKRDHIIRAAITVFSRDGFHWAKVEEIAREAGVGKGTVYQYFASKEELFREMFKGTVRAHLDVLRRRVLAARDPVSALRELVSCSLGVTRDERERAKVLLENPGGIDDELKGWLLSVRWEVVDLVQRLVEEGIRRGLFRPIHPRVAATMIIGGSRAISGAFIFGDQGLPSVEEAAEAAVELLRSGICLA